jgi:DNA topoisomerase-6 subunit B
LQSAGRKLAMYLRRRLKVKQEGERRNVFLRYLGEVATAVSDINRFDRKKLYDQLLLVAKKKTAQADMKLDQRGKVIEETDDDLASDPNVLIVEPTNDFGIRTTESTNGKKGS